MGLAQSFEESGSWLFRYRGQIPVVLFFVAIPVIYTTDYELLSPTWAAAIQIAGVAVSIAGFIFRAWAIGTTPKGTSGRNREKQVAESLNTTGLYSLVRHPLYLGNYLMWVGIVIYVVNIWFFIAGTLAFWLYYERIMFAEECFLERKFGEEFIIWSSKTPAFMPNLRAYVKTEIHFSIKDVLRREYSGFLAAVIGFLFVDVIRDFFAAGRLELNYNYIVVFSAALFIALLLRTMKHHTRLLEDKNRS